MFGIAPIVVIVGNYLYFLLYYTIIKINNFRKYSGSKIFKVLVQKCSGKTKGEQANGTA